MDRWDTSPATTPCAFQLDRTHKGGEIKTFRISLWPAMWYFIIIISVSCTIVLCQDHIELKYELFEEEIEGKVIGNVKQDSRIIHLLHDPSAVNRLRFQFLSNPKINVAIDEISGILRVSGRIDRDSVCPSKIKCQLIVDVATKPVDIFQIIKVTLDLLDKNDNSPQFTPPEMTHRILESSLPGTSINLPVAKDLDSPKYGIKRYELLSIEDANTFELKKSEKIDGSTELKLILNTELNREERDRYHLRIKAYDGGKSSKKGVMDVYVEVEDTNDNPPVFQNSTYNVYTPETKPTGSALIKVQAVDRDLGLNGEVEYSFSSFSKETYGNTFEINPITGVIKLRKNLDYEEVDLYTLTVTARDKGPNSIPTETTVVVHVLDDNDHPPEITVNTLSATDTDTATVVEHADVETFVAHISVKDLDSGNNGRVNCSLADNHFELKQLYTSEYKIITNILLDREVKERYALSLRCKDSGARPQTSIKLIKVTVEDINDNPPVFSRDNYVASIMENNYEGYFILKVNATDADSGKNAKITYSLPNDMSTYLSINSTTGRITAKSKMDREGGPGPQLHFPVEAKDNGDPVRTGSAFVTINIEDVNDEPPIFSDKGYNFFFKEKQKAGTDVGNIEANDGDAAPNNKFSYELEAVNHRDLEKFEIDKKSGVIRTKKVLDREEKAVYMLRAKAIDDHNPKLSSQATVDIRIGDINDNKPIWKFPTKANSTINISNKAPPKHKLARLEATDLDASSYISYEIQHGNEDSNFILDSVSGILSVNEPLNDISYHSFKLEFIAKDGGRPPNSASTVLYIVVNESIPFPLQQTGTSHILSGTNFTIVVSLTCACLILCVILITVIVIIRRKERKKRIHKYNCRMEALKMLTAKDPCKVGGGGGGGGGSLDHSPIQTTGHMCYNDPYRDCTGSLKKDISGCNNTLHSNNTINGTWSGPEKHKVKFASPPDRYVSKPTHPGRSLEKREVEVHRFLDSLGDGDRDSLHSGDGSNTDSGRGPSEEGEAAARHHADAQKGISQRQGQYSRPQCSTLPIHSRPQVHLNQQQPLPPTRFQTFSPPSRTAPHSGDTETTYVPNNNNSSHNPAKQVKFMPTSSVHSTETTYVPNSTHSTPTHGRFVPRSTETTFTSNNGDTVETTYVPHTISTLSNCRTRYNQKYFPVNNNVKDTTL